MTTTEQAERRIADVLLDHGRGNSIVLNMPREEYFAIRAMNASTLVDGLVGNGFYDPTCIRDSFENNRPEASQSQRDSFDRGTLAHYILLQPEMLPGKVAICGGQTRRGKEWEAFEKENVGKIIMRGADVRSVQQVCREFRKNKEVSELLRPCETEITVFAREGNVFCKGMIDAVTRDGLCVMIDPKTTATGIDEDSVRRTIRKFHYREKMGLYRRWYTKATGRNVDDAFLLFLSLPPNRPGIAKVRLTAAALDWGEDRMLGAIRSVQECIEADSFPTFFANYVCDVSEYEQGKVELTGFEEVKDEGQNE